MLDISDNRAEWNQVDDELLGEMNLWQHHLYREAFSEDGGTTYYLLTECHDGNKVMHNSIQHQPT